MGDISQATRGFLGGGAGGGGSGPAIISTTTPNPNQIVIQWSENVTLTPFATTDLALAFVITPPLGFGAVSAVSVSLSDPTHMVITTTDQAIGEAYSMVVASGVVNAVDGTNGSTTVHFTGNDTAFGVASHRYVDGMDFIVVFNRTAEQSSASNPVNYVFVPALVIHQIQRLDPVTYLLKTAVMAPSTPFTITVSNVKDLAGNVI